ncbi:hypothetical protein ACX93W_21225 [Paenibacillus sp. CAU 1782]
MSVEKYRGRRIELIYIDGREHVSQRIVVVFGIRNGTMIAFDTGKNRPRSFRLDRILAISPASGHAS